MPRHGQSACSVPRTFIRRGALCFGLALALMGAAGLGPAVAAQTTSTACLPGESPSARVDQFLASLIADAGAPEGLTPIEARLGCPVVLPLLYLNDGGNWLGIDRGEIQRAYEAGDSPATIAQSRATDRTAAIEAMTALYLDALDRAFEIGAIIEEERDWIADVMTPQFGWLVDRQHGDPVSSVAASNELDEVANLLALLPGGSEEEQVDNLLSAVLSAGDAKSPVWQRVAERAVAGDLWLTLGVGLNETVLGALSAQGGAATDAAFASYRGGQSVVEIYEASGGNGADLAQQLLTQSNQTLDDAVAAGELDAAERGRAGHEVELVIVVVLKHHQSNPIPHDFGVLTFDPAARSSTAESKETPSLEQAATCNGVEATLVVPLIGGFPVAVFEGTSGDDVIVGTEFNDAIDGLGGDDLICSGQGHDVVNGGAGRDEIYGGPGNDTISGERDCQFSNTVVVTGNDDVLYGGYGDDLLCGQIGADVLSGDNGHDTLRGGDGRDELFGGDGDDELDGGEGRDQCSPGSGNDTLSRC